jgi:hypothetical protein
MTDSERWCRERERRDRQWRREFRQHMNTARIKREWPARDCPACGERHR